MLLEQYQGEHVEIKIVGARPHERPYLRVGFVGGNYIASEDNANALRGLARQIFRALGDEVPKR